MFAIASQIYQQKIKCKDGVSYFYKNQKYRRLEKILLSVISFQKFAIFPLWAFSENDQCFVGAFL